MSAADTAWAEHTDAYAIGRASRDAEVAELKAKLEQAEARVLALRQGLERVETELGKYACGKPEWRIAYDALKADDQAARHAFAAATERPFPRKGQTHELKTVEPHFSDVVVGRKTFEVRRDDRGFCAGDWLHLRHYNAQEETYGDRSALVKVTSLLRGPQFGVEDGYVVEWRVLDAADFGTPSFRERLVLIARCDGKPIGWPTPTHGPGRRRPYIAAETCIEWDRPVRSIFDRGKLPALKSQERIAVGIKRFVLSRPPLIRNGLAWCGFVRGYGERPGQETRTLDLAGPLHTIVAGGVKDGLVAVWLIKHYTGVFGVPLSAPMGTITARDHHALGAVYLTRERQEQTEAWLRSMLGDIDLTVRHEGETWRIADVGTRMLAPTELL